MAKAAFHKGQRVYVRALGIWANVERVVPQWVKGVEAPLKIYYDLDLGREFSAGELSAPSAPPAEFGAHWRVRRVAAAGLRVDLPEKAGASLPCVVTQEDDWGGWRVDAAEYDRDSAKIEHEARLICAAPAMFEAARALVEAAERGPETIPPSLTSALALAQEALRIVYGVDEPQAPELEDGIGL